jgi:hypothetical protein
LGTREEVNRIFGNRHGEAHPFKRDSAGIEWFSRMFPLVDQLTAEEMRDFLLPMVDELLASMEHCLLCQAKLLVFAELFCSRRLPLRARAYWVRQQTLVWHAAKGSYSRDLRAEVYEALDRYGVQGD